MRLQVNIYWRVVTIIIVIVLIGSQIEGKFCCYGSMGFVKALDEDAMYSMLQELLYFCPKIDGLFTSKAYSQTPC